MPDKVGTGIRMYGDQDRDAWNAYVMGHGKGTVFHLVHWKDVVERSFGHRSFYLMAEQDHRVTGVLPLFEMKSVLFGHYLVSVPFAELGGPLGDTSEIETALVDTASRMTDERRAGYLELRNRIEIHGLETKSLYVTFKKSISHDPEANLKAIPRKSRAMIRKGINNGLRSQVGHEFFDQFYDIMLENYHRLGTPIFSKRFFRNFLEVYKTDANVLLVSSKSGDPAAAVLFFLFKDQIIPYYAGSVFSMRELATNDFMYWELMKLGAEKGCRIFDFGRSKIGTGSFSFKKHWGFDPIPLAYQYHLATADSLPNLSPANPKYQKKIQLWKQLPLGITRYLGPMLSRHLA